MKHSQNQTRVQEAVAAFGAFTCGIILEELYLSPAFGALDVENGPRLPVLAVLSRTFHYFSPKVDNLVKSRKAPVVVIPAKAGIQ